MTLLRISSLLAAVALTTTVHAQTPLTPDYSFTGETVDSKPRIITRWESSRYDTGVAKNIEIKSKAAILKKDGNEKAYTCDELEDVAIQDQAKNNSSNSYQTQKISELNQTELDKAWRGAGCVTKQGNANPRFIRAPKPRANAPIAGSPTSQPS